MSKIRPNWSKLFSKVSFIKTGTLVILFASTFNLNFPVQAASNYPAYKFPWRAGEIWQQRPYDVHRDRFGLALDFLPINGTLEVLAMAPGRVSRGCTTKDNMQTLVWIETISRGVNYGEKVGYFHLNPKTLTVKTGDFVRRGEILGEIATNLKDYSSDPCNLMSWFEPHLHVSLPEEAFPITIDGQVFEAPKSQIIFSGPVDKTEEKYKFRNFASTNSLNVIWNGIFVNARTVTQNDTNLRNSPAGSIIDKILANTKAKIISGPVEAFIGKNDYTWWQIELENGQTGWSIQDSLKVRQVVATGSGVNVRRTAGGSKIGRVSKGQYGVLASGVVKASIDDQEYDWIAVNWNDGSVGWSVLDPSFVRIIN